jgi:magnesium and cobalt transporter
MEQTNKSKEKPPRPWWQRWLKEHFSLCIDNRNELIAELHNAQNKDLISNDSLGMIEGVLNIEELQVRDIMAQRHQIEFLHVDSSFPELVNEILKSNHSRYPVFDDNRDDIEGLLLAKELLAHIGKEDEFHIHDVIKPIKRVPESQPLRSLLTEFRNERQHMAIVIDEYSGISGLVTIEDILEKIVGDIEDEHDDIDEKAWIQFKKTNEYSVDATIPVEEFNTTFKTKLPTDRFDTLGGIVMNRMGKIPHQGEELNIDDLHIKITRSDGRRVLSMDVTRTKHLKNKKKTEAIAA